MSWDESLFQTFFQTFNKIKNKESLANQQHQVDLVSLLSRLSLMASALAEAPLQLYPVRQGPGRTRHRSLILPVAVNCFRDRNLNEYVYVGRTAFSALVIREFRLEFGKTSALTQGNWIETLSRKFWVDFPGMMALLDDLDRKALDCMDLSSWLNLSRGTFPVEDFDALYDEPGIGITLDSKNEGKQDELENLRPSLAKVRQLDTRDTNPAVHVFEKVLTAEDYQGGKRQIDSDGDSSDPSGALAELDMDQMVRATGETGSTYNGGLFLDDAFTQSTQGAVIKNEIKVFCYPEWSRRRLQFLPNWCRVVEEKKHPEGKLGIPLKSSLMKQEAKRLKRELEILVNRPIWVRDQQDGTELDLDAVVRLKSDLKAGSSIPKNLFMDRKKLEQDIALLILADVSLSTDAWIANQRVLDTIQQSLHILSEALEDFPQTVSMAAFHSNTRNHCTYLRLKDFHENWEQVPQQITELKPQGYTRIGPAIRHATRLLKETRARRKLLLIISDSKPTDYDAYEGIHGESDVHHAVLEARSQRITVKGLAVADSRSGHVKRIYGQGGFEKFTNARGLSERVIRVYTEALKAPI